MANPHDKDLEEDLELDDVEDSEEESDEDDADTKGDKGKGKGKGKESEDSDAEEEADELDDSEGEDDGGAKKAEAERQKEELRARRRREKKLKRERDRRDRMQLQNTVVALQKELKDIREGGNQLYNNVNQITEQQMNSEMNELANAYNASQAAMEKAISEGDGASFTKAKNISDKAWQRYTTLQMAKQQRQATTQQQQKKQETQQQEEASFGEEAQRLGKNWASKNKAWYDPSGGNLDSRIVQAIDTDLFNEGYDPETQEYWDELTDRVKDRLPHRYRNTAANGTQKKKPPQIVGGGGGDQSSGSGSSEKTLPKELVASLKAAGMWDDKELRKKAIRDYQQNRKRSA